MEQKMDAEGGRVLRRSRRVRKLAVVVAVQNVLVVVCLLVTLYVYRDVQSKEMTSDDSAHIHCDPISNPDSDAVLGFKGIRSISRMELNDRKDQIRIECTGPYVWYVEVCWESAGPETTSGTLWLQVAGRSVSWFTLQANGTVCRGHQNTSYLRSKEVVSVYFNSTSSGFSIRNVSMGLSFLLKNSIC